MAKKASKSASEKESKESNKSQAIRDYMSANPDAGPTSVAQALNEREGWKISAAYVSTIKNKLKQPGTTRGAGGRGRSSGGRDGGLSEKSLMQAKELLKQAGGINQAKAALELLARLTS